jgi:mono/diheme cytochrome c family protein
MRFVTLLIWLSLLCAVEAQAEDAPGKQLFDRHCAECHAPGHGHPGTQRLAWSRGERYAVLEQRQDLSADYIRAIVRRGLFEMPPFRPTEISEQDLALLSAYLTGRRIR